MSVEASLSYAIFVFTPHYTMLIIVQWTALPKVCVCEGGGPLLFPLPKYYWGDHEHFGCHRLPIVIGSESITLWVPIYPIVSCHHRKLFHNPCERWRIPFWLLFSSTSQADDMWPSPHSLILKYNSHCRCTAWLCICTIKGNVTTRIIGPAASRPCTGTIQA